MGLINGALQIGRSALAAQQAGLLVTANNVANAATENYTRRAVRLEPVRGNPIDGRMYAGAGVTVSAVQRMVDEALESRIRAAGGDAAAADAQQQILARIEALFNELTDDDLSTRLSDFFNSFSDLQNTPQDMSMRAVVLQKASSLTQFITDVNADLHSIADDIDQQISSAVVDVDRLLSQIAGLNEQIVAAESGQLGSAASLRDQQGALLSELSELVNITTYQTESGAINVFIGSVPAVEFTRARSVTVQNQTDEDGQIRMHVVYADNDADLQITSGKLYGLLQGRDVHVQQCIDDLDRLAAALIQEVNKLHAEGQGLSGLTSVTGTYVVDDATAPLNAAGLDLTPVNGTFEIWVGPDGGEPTATLIHVDLDGLGSDTSLQDLASMLDAVDNISATVAGDGTLQVTADNGYSFTFANDSSNVLAALGVNTFFDGHDSASIRVRSELQDSPALIAAATNRLPGDNSNAARIAQLADSAVSSLGGMSINEFYNSMIGQVAVSTAAARDDLDSTRVVQSALKSQRQALSGVSLDEEAVNMLRYQRAFQGAARLISVVDELMQQLLAMTA